MTEAQTFTPESRPSVRVVAIVAGLIGVALGAVIALIVLTAVDDGPSAPAPPISPARSDRLLASLARMFDGTRTDTLVIGGLVRDSPDVFEALAAASDGGLLGSMASASFMGVPRSDFVWFQLGDTPAQALDRAARIAREHGWVDPPTVVRMAAAADERALMLCRAPGQEEGQLTLLAFPLAEVTVVRVALTSGPPIGDNPCAAGARN